MAKKKFYAVAVGRRCGIFNDWPTAEKQVKGFAGAKFKSFAAEVEAQKWLEDPVYTSGKKVQKNKRPKKVAEITEFSRCSPGEIVIFTDGGAINNPGPGGYGIVIKEEEGYRELSGGYRLTTNNRMEMIAAIVALESLDSKSRNKRINLYSDSSYLVNGIEKGWAEKWQANGWLKSDKKKAQNIDLWQRLLSVLEDCSVSFHWVKGHAGTELNERCDQLVGAASRSSDQAIDIEYEKNN